MLGSIWAFIKRHRRKFVIVGVLFGGAVLIGKYAKRKLLEYQEKEANECLMQIRRQHHFDSNQRNCNTTVLSLIPRLRETLCHLLDSEVLTSQLKTRPVNKMEIWEELKILSFTRTIVAVYSSALLAVFLRVQLNILGGYMYRSTQGGYSGKSYPAVTNETQKQYLALVHYLFEQGIGDLIAVVRSAVIKEIGSLSLKDSVSSANVSVIISGVRQRVEGLRRNGCSNGVCVGGGLSRFIMAPVDEGLSEASGITTQETLARQLEDETRDVIQSADFNVVLTSCIDSSFLWLVNRTSEYFVPASGLNGFVSVTEGAMPLAKVIPIVNGLVHTVLADQPNPLVQELLLREQVKDFAVNIYDAFCEVPPGCALSSC